MSYRFTDDTGATDTVTMALAQQSPADTQATCSITGPTADDFACTTDGVNQFVLLPPTRRNLSPADRSQFAQELANLCDGPHSANGQASSTFTPDGSTFRYVVDPQGITNQANTQPGRYA